MGWIPEKTCALGRLCKEKEKGLRQNLLVTKTNIQTKEGIKVKAKKVGGVNVIKAINPRHARFTLTEHPTG